MITRSRIKAKKLTSLAAALASLTLAPPIGAQAPQDVQTAFLQWAQKSLHPVSNADLDGSTKDLRPLESMIGDAKIVGLSEGIHAAAEPLIFRNRVAHQVRDRAMADNLEWVRSRLGPRARVLVFTAVGHLASTVVQLPDHQIREMVPLGAHIKDRYGSDFVNILNLVVNGEIKYCSANPRRLMPLKPPPESAVETLFAGVNVPQYALDLRSAPPRVSSWLHQVHDHWNGFGTQQFATANAFDLVYYVSPVTSACVPQAEPAP